MKFFGKCKFSGYGITIYACRSFSLSDGSDSGKNIIIFAADMSSSVNIDNETKSILILVKGPRFRQ